MRERARRISLAVAARLVPATAPTMACRSGLAVVAGLILVTTAIAAQPSHAAAGRAAPGVAASAVRPARYLSLPGVTAPGMAPASSAGAVAPSPAGPQAGAPAGGLLQADLLIAAPAPLSGGAAAAVRKLSGVVAAQPVDAARINVAGKVTAILGVDPAQFRVFAAKPTADAARLWHNVADGDVAISYTMGTLDKLPLNRPVQVSGRHTMKLPLAGLGTTGIAGVDAVVSDSVARSLGIPSGNAIVVSAPHVNLSKLTAQIKPLLPASAAIAPLVAQAASGGSAPVSPVGTASTGTGASAGSGASSSLGTASTGPGLTQAQVVAFLKAAESRRGLPYVWGGSGPNVFDCSGLVQWSLARAGIRMPRVAADQALTGPRVAVSQLQPGDLLFYHTDPTAPGYISHVAIYLGGGVMLQAPEPGLDVEAVPAAFGSEFAGAISVYPAVAASVATESAD